MIEKSIPTSFLLKERVNLIKSYVFELWMVYRNGLSPAFKLSFVISLINVLI
jgi:hypothetical protein